MNDTQKQPAQNDMGTLAKDARSLMTATTDVAAQKFGEARQAIVEKVVSAKETAGRLRDQAVNYAKVADQALHKHPYKALGIALGVGALLGYLVFRRGSTNAER
jgi:ElaB/YqjD/DUF883 family membrane-anchored ribosome-binding protein